LKDNNNIEWFTENKPCYEADIITPCLNFMVDMGELLKEISHHYTAIPKKSGGSMFRIYRDARFSMNKNPYKENAASNSVIKLLKMLMPPAFTSTLKKTASFMVVAFGLPKIPPLEKLAYGLNKKLTDIFVLNFRLHQLPPL
jgi:uncharacterized protein (TIGR02453 family)